MADDLITGRLDAIRERRANSMIGGLFRPTVAQLDLDVDDLPRLLAALEDVLKVHRPHEVPVSRICPAHASGPLWRASATLSQFRDEIEACSDCLTEPDLFCAECSDESWPCPTYAAIERALTGEDPQ